MNYPDYITFPAGSARVVDQGRFSDGSTALRIHNFNIDERGNLDSTFHVMPLIGNGWTADSQPAAFNDGTGVLGMCFARFDGLVPQILFVTASGVFQFAPWFRGSATTNGGLWEHKTYKDTTASSVTPAGRRWYPPQFEQVGDRVYFTLGDGGRAYVWDGARLRDFGYRQTPGAPQVVGPATTSTGLTDNAGGWSHRGRIGTTDIDVGEHGALLEGEYVYAVVFEGPDGAYSATSATSGSVLISNEKAAAASLLDNMRRRFWCREIARGPDPTAARIILRTPNLRFLPDGVGPELRFLHRLPGSTGTEWVDDIPDGELGPVWEHRASAPTGFYFMSWLSGSMFVGGTDGNPSRVWWSEQSNVNGPTPESFMEGHWRDVYPGTGPIRGLHKARLPSDQAQPCLLVFKERATHYIAGEYPQWAVGTLHDGAGLCGPGLVQSTPDNAVVWFGAGTFWQFRSDGQVVDIGGPISEDLARVNLALSRKGSSYVDQRRGEARFFLALDDMDGCEYQFIWDFRRQGWRTAQTFEATAALRIEEDDLTLVAGSFGNAQTVYAVGRTYPQSSYTSPTAVYQTGWLVIPGTKRTPSGSTWIPKGLTITMEERGEGSMDIEGYVDWDDTTAATTVDDLLVVHPEATVPFWTSTNMALATDPAMYDGASETRTLNVTGGSTGAGTIVVTLAGTAVNVAISGAMAANPVAAEIAATTFAGWLVQRYGSLVTFIAETPEVKTGAFTFAAGGSGATATGPTQQVAGAATGDGDVWRKRRTFTTHTGFDTGTTQALSIKLESSRPMCLLAMDVHGAYAAGPGGRTPQQEY